jgi:prepilin-type N-terminal cleavage/methylation domain-containing protein
MENHTRDGNGTACRAGMTLIEVLIALLIIAFAFGGMYVLATMASRTSSRARSHYVAINVAKSRLESAKSRDIAQIDRFLESNSVVNADGLACVDGEFRRSTSVTSVGTGIVEVTVMVDIRDPATGLFGGEHETVSAQLTDFKDKPR